MTQLRYCGMFNNYANANFQQSVPVKKNYNRSTCGKDMDNLVDSFLWPTAYISNDSGQLSLLSLRSRHIEYQPVWLGLKWGMFSCVGWHVTLCDLIWQATLRSAEMGSGSFSTVKTSRSAGRSRVDMYTVVRQESYAFSAWCLVCSGR